MTFPSAADYSSAVLQPDRFVLDPVLKHCKPVMRQGTMGMPLLYSGGYAKVYKFTEASGKSYAFRCWSIDIGDVAKVYREVGNYLAPLKQPFFIDFHFAQEAILVNGRKFPGIRMDWIDAPSLQEFAALRLRDSVMLEACAESFLQVTRYLHQVHVSHGDLQGDNIRVRLTSGRPELVLIDYDTMYVPALRSRPAVSSGLPAYQHPQRIQSKVISEKDDYFSELVIYLGLLALARSNTARETFAKASHDKEFLFTETDIREPEQSTLLRKLRKEADPTIRSLTNSLIDACRQPSIDQLAPLEQLIKDPSSAAAGPIRPLTEANIFLKSGLVSDASSHWNAGGVRTGRNSIFQGMGLEVSTDLTKDKPSRRRAWVWVLVVIFVLAIIVAVSVWAANQHSPFSSRATQRRWQGTHADALCGAVNASTGSIQFTSWQQSD